MMLPKLLDDWKFKDDQTYGILGTVIFDPYIMCSTWRCFLTICIPSMYGILKPWLGQCFLQSPSTFQFFDIKGSYR